MSRIGSKSIQLPEKVKVDVAESGEVKVEGPRGRLNWQLPGPIGVSIEEGDIQVQRQDESRRTRALHGLSRSILANMVRGVHEGFKKELEIQGVGFRAAVKGKVLNLNLGFSHPIDHPIPEGVKITVADNTKVTVEGIDKQLVGQVAADIRGYYPVEPYKGKGIRYVGEHVIRKEGKTVQ